MRWPQYRLLARRRWRALSEAQLDLICGLRELLAQNLQQSYALSRETAERDIDAWISTFDEEPYAIGEELYDAVDGPRGQALKAALEQRRRTDPRR